LACWVGRGIEAQTFEGFLQGRLFMQNASLTLVGRWVLARMAAMAHSALRYVSVRAVLR
jgi:hypothetical protein